MTDAQRAHFERTVLALRAELRRAASRLGGAARADDLVQETFLRALVAWQRVDPRSNVRAFLHTILRNTFLNQQRRAGRETLYGSEPPEHGLSFDRALLCDLRRALAELPEPLRQVLLAVDVEGLAYREAAVRAGAPIGTIMSRLHRARARMAQKLAA